MSNFDQYLGRTEYVGLGIEGDDNATRGTAVAPQVFFRWLDNDLQPKQNIIENESAMGTVVKVNDSAITGKWMEGTLGGKVSDIGIGYPLLGMFGDVTSVTTGGTTKHTFSLRQSSVPRTLTTTIKNPSATVQYPYSVIDSLEISGEAKGYVQVSMPMKARVGSSTSVSPAFVAEKEFTIANVEIRMADTIANLAAAPLVDASSFKITLDRTVGDPYFPMGPAGANAPEFDRGPWEAKGSLVLRYKSTDFEDDWLANAVKAMRITMTNGSSILNFDGGRVRIRELTKSKGRDDIVTQSISLYFEPDTATGKTIIPELTNTQAAYVAAA